MFSLLCRPELERFLTPNRALKQIFGGLAPEIAAASIASLRRRLPDINAATFNRMLKEKGKFDGIDYERLVADYAGEYYAKLLDGEEAG